MILNYSWAVWLAWLLGAFFVLEGLRRLTGARPTWSPPAGNAARSRFSVFGSVGHIAAGLMIAWYPARPFGLLLGLALCVAACAVLVMRRDVARLAPPVALGAVILATAWGLRLI